MKLVPHRIRLTALATLFALAGCGDGAMSPSERAESLAEDAATGAPLEALRWTSSFSSRLSVGQTMRIGARFYDSRGRANPSTAVRYSSSDPSIATIDGSGLIRGVSPGISAISARAGRTTSRFQLAVVPATSAVSRLVISLPATVIVPGDSMRAKAVAYDATGHVVDDDEPNWSVVKGAPEIATIDKRGEITARAPGRAVIAAAMRGVRDTIVLNVSSSRQATAASLRRVDDGGGSLVVGAGMQLAIEALDDSKSVIAGKKISFRSSAASVLKVSATGLLTGVSAGSGTITATADGASLKVPIVVTSSSTTGQSVAKVTVSLGRSTLPVGETTAAIAHAVDSAGKAIGSVTATWSVPAASNQVAAVSSSGAVTALAAGSAVVRATVNGVTGSATLIVTGGSSTPPPSGGGIAVAVQRFDGQSGAVLVSNAIPLPKGRLFPGDAKQVRVYVNGAEQSVYSEALRGLHSDGSLRSVLVQFQHSVPSSGHLAGQIVLGQARGTSDLTKPTANRTQLKAVALPTNVGYLLSTEINGPTISVAQSTALGGVYAAYERDFATYADYHWNRNGAFWQENYYDRALIYYAFWVRTANPVYFERATLLAVGYRTQYLEKVNYRPSPHWSQLEGLEQHYLLTGDERSRTAVQRVAETLTGYHSVLSDHSVSPWMESRIQARVLHAYLLAWRLQVPGANWASRLDDGLNRVLSTQKSDGSYGFRSTCQGSLNYMTGMLNDVYIKTYRLYRADSRLPTAIKRSLDYLWTQWQPGTSSFNYLSAWCQVVSGTWVGGPSAAPDLNNLIVTGFSWYGRYAGDPGYLQKAEQIFGGGVRGAFLKGTKQFNEEYSTSFRHLGFR